MFSVPRTVNPLSSKYLLVKFDWNFQFRFWKKFSGLTKSFTNFTNCHPSNLMGHFVQSLFLPNLSKLSCKPNYMCWWHTQVFWMHLLNHILPKVLFIIFYCLGKYFMYVFCKLDQRRANIAPTNQQHRMMLPEKYLFKVNFVEPSTGMMVHARPTTV